MSKKYVMSLDEGTTSCRCILFDKKGNTVSVAQRKFEQIYPQPGWVEHDAAEIWSAQLDVAREAMQKVGAAASDIAAIGITNQRETTVVWDKNTGKPVYHSIVWQCRRTADFCEGLANEENVRLIREKTGLPIDPYFSGTKIRWILDHAPGAREKAAAGELLFGTIDTWLIWNLSGGKLHITDYSNASRTMLFNIHTLQWDEEILALLDIPASMLPEAVPNSMIYGETDAALFGGPIVIGGAAGDQQAALFGQTCFDAGEAKNTYGTGAFLLMNTGEKPVASEHGLVTTIAWSIGGKVYYALEGSIFMAGAAVQWVRDGLEFFAKSAESEVLAAAVPDTGGVYLVPAFTGLGAPYWDPYARGAIFGITRGTNKYHITRATLESIAYQTYDVLHAMEQDSGIRLSSLKADGGVSANDFLMQFQADIIRTEVKCPAALETTALGAAYLAGLSVGFWEDLEDIRQNWTPDRSFVPRLSSEEAVNKLAGWHDAVARVIRK